MQPGGDSLAKWLLLIKSLWEIEVLIPRFVGSVLWGGQLCLGSLANTRIGVSLKGELLDVYSSGLDFRPEQCSRLDDPLNWD